MSSGTEETTHHWLLPHERYWVQRTFARYEARPNSAYVLRVQQNYGPTGLVFLAAARASQAPGYISGVLGGLLLAASQAQGAIAIAGYASCGLTFMLGVLGFCRAVQSGRAGRRFRNGRPFLYRKW